MRLPIATLAITFVVAAAPAWAQGGSDPMAAARAMAANQLGVMEYCQSQGHVDAAAMEAQRKIYGQLPPGPGDTNQPEALGRQGIMSMNGTDTSLADFATRGHSTVATICQQMGASALQSAAMMSGMTGMPGVGGMPSMPGGMPTMSGAMPSGMPSGIPGGMPGMPSGMPSGLPGGLPAAR